MPSRAFLVSFCWVLQVAFAAGTWPKGLPDGPIIAAWQNWNACNQTQTLAVVEQGVNVIFWFAINLAKDRETQQPKITGGPDMGCVAEVREAIERLGFPTSHLITIGGWDAPHPDTSFSGAQWFDAWNEWNQKLPVPFDGFDWDLEGNDMLTSPWNVFTPECLQLVIDMSVTAKKAGMLATLAPPQSTFDVTTQEFNRFLNNSNPDFHPDFKYEGRNSYAYVLAAAPAGTFDLVEVQLYETFAPAMRSLAAGIPGQDYLRQWAEKVLAGWTINVTDPLLPVKGLLPVQLQQSQFIVGLSFALGSAGRSAFFWPDQVAQAYQAADPSQRPRGYSFWCIALEGSKVNGTNTTVDFASSLNSFLHVRRLSAEDSKGELLDHLVV